MSLYDFNVSRQIWAEDPPFYALIMAAMRKADPDNLEKLKAVFPETWAELKERYWAPGGLTAAEVARNADKRDNLEEKA
jgi:hypothetical protein